MRFLSEDALYLMLTSLNLTSALATTDGSSSHTVTHITSETIAFLMYQNDPCLASRPLLITLPLLQIV